MKAGDILAVKGTAWFSKRILEATHGSVSHVGILISTDPPMVIEALDRVKTRLLSVSIAEAEKAYLLSDKTLTDEQRKGLVATALNFSAEGYGYGDILLQGIDSITDSTWWTDHLAVGLDKIPICSYLVAKDYFGYGKTFGDKKIESITPSDIYNFALAHPDKYDINELK